MGVSNKNFAKIGYLFFQLFWIIIAITILFLTKSIVGILPEFLQCPPESGDRTACLGPSAIIRMSFVLACFHLVVFCVVLARNTFASVFHDGCWMFKFMFVLLFFSVSLFIPNSFFQGYMVFTRYLSAFFLLVQAALMLVVAYKINERLIKNYEMEAPGNGLGISGVIVIILTLLFTAGNVTWVVFQYKWYSSCAGSATIMSITLVFCVGFYILVLFRTREDASLLTSAIVVCYILYLQWSALASNPDSECNPSLDSNANTVL
jgi:hypothetical protein